MDVARPRSRSARPLLLLAAASSCALGALPVRAAEIGVTPSKLVVIDKLSASGKAKAVYVAKDAAVDKGAGADEADIGAELVVTYSGASATARGGFRLPKGASDGVSGWLVNDASGAKYTNKDAPSGATGAKVGLIKQNSRVMVVGKTLGDTPIDLVNSGAPTGSVFTAFVVDNGGTVNRLCSSFAGCTFKEIAQGTGRKLACKSGAPDPLCSRYARRS